MSHDVISNWVEKAKSNVTTVSTSSGVQVIRREDKQRNIGEIILEIADKIRPWITQRLNGARDKNGLLVQPSTVRAIAINVAQRLIKEEEELQKKSSA